MCDLMTYYNELFHGRHRIFPFQIFKGNHYNCLIITKYYMASIEFSGIKYSNHQT